MSDKGGGSGGLTVPVNDYGQGQDGGSKDPVGNGKDGGPKDPVGDAKDGGPKDPVEDFEPPAWAPDEDPLTPPPVDPLVLDLDGDGVELLSVGASRAHFDLDGDGFRERTGWVAPDDALLAFDRNGNGAVDGIGELLGNAAEDGFVALARLDSNGDGKVDAADQDFAKLGVWRDANSNGTFDAGELTSLGAAGIASMSLATTASGARAAGNALGFTGSYTRADGSTSQVASAYFETNSLLSRWTPPDGFTVNAEAAKLPGLKGYGTVMDLKYAMSLDAQLLAAVKAYVLASGTMSGAELRAGFEAILFKWSGTEAVAAGSRGTSVDARHLAVLEKFYDNAFVQRTPFGSVFSTNPNAQTGKVLEGVYENLLSSTLTHLLSQATVSTLIQKGGAANASDFALRPLLGLAYGVGTDKLHGNVAQVVAQIAQGGASLTGTAALVHYDRLMTAIAGARVDLFKGDAAGFVAAMRTGLASVEDAAVREFAIARASQGSWITGDGAASNVAGTAGDDVIWAKGSADVLSGGTGADIYIYAKGNGADTIIETWDQEGTTGDRVLLPGLKVGDVSFARAGNDLVITVIGSLGDSLTVKDQFSGNAQYGVETFVFADGVVLNRQQATDLITIGTSGADTLVGVSGAELFDGKGALAGTQDYAEGGGGADTFIFKAGYGHLEINEDAGFWNHSTAVLRFGAGITADMLGATKDAAGNIYLTTSTTGDRVQINAQMNGAGWHGDQYGIATVQLADGTTLTRQQVMALTTIGTDGADTLIGTSGADVFDGKGALAGTQDYAEGKGGANTFVFKAGYGHLEINEDTGFWNQNGTTLQLGVGITAGMLSATKDSAGNVFLSDGIAGDQVKINGLMSKAGWYGTQYGVNQVQFANGTMLTRQQLMAMAQIVGTSGADTLTGTADADPFDGRGAAAGSQDVAQGDGGADVFIFKAGYGHLKVIEDAGFWNCNTAVLQFGAGITADMLGATKDAAGNIYLTNGTVGDRVQIDGQMNPAGWYGDQYGISAVQLADGTVLNRQQVAALTTIGTRGADTLVGTSGAELFDGKGALAGSQDYAEGAGGADTFMFKAGYGRLEIKQDTGFWNQNGATLQLGAGITAAMLDITKDGAGNVTITNGIAGDAVQIDAMMNAAGWYGTQYGVSKVQFADGTALSRQQVMAMAKIMGTAGADVLTGTASADVFDGKGASTGSQDVVQGNGGADTFIFKAGYGRLEINEDAGFWNRNTAVLQFGAGITADMLVASKDSAGNVIVTDGTPGDQVQISGMMNLVGWYGDQYGISAVRFDDGTTLDRQQVMALTTIGTNGSDSLIGTSRADLFDGKGALAGTQDYAEGGGGNDTFVFKAGYGRLEIKEDTGFWNPNNAVLQFGAGITADMLDATKDAAGNVYLTNGIAGDQVKIDGMMNAAGWYGSQYGVSQVRFADSTVLSRQQVLAMAQIVGTAGADVLVGTTDADPFDGKGASAGSQDVAQGNGGADVFIFNKGYGHLQVIEDAGFWNRNTSVLRFGTGITADMLGATKDSAGNIYLTDGTAGDRVQINGMMNGAGWYGDQYGVSMVQLAGGTTLTRQQVMALTTIGTGGADTLIGTASADLFDGKGALAGSQDYAEGRGGADVFAFNKGYGQLEVNEDAGFWNPNTAELRLGAGITVADVSVTKDGAGNVIITDGTAGDVIQVDGLLVTSGWYGNQLGVARMTFADGTAWTRSQIAALAGMGTTGADTIAGTSGNDVFDGRGGADTINGGGGSDAYLFRQGYGPLTINNAIPGGGVARGEVDLGLGITSQNLWFSRSGDNLVASVLGSADTVNLKNWFGTDASAQVAAFKGYDGLKLDSQVGQLVTAMAAYAGSNPGFDPMTATMMPTDPALRSALGAAWHS